MVEVKPDENFMNMKWEDNLEYTYFTNELNFGQYHKYIQSVLFEQCRDCKINFWVDDDKEIGKSFLVTIQSSTNNDPDPIQYAINQVSYDKWELKLKTIPLRLIVSRYKKILDWKIRTKHENNQLKELWRIVEKFE